MHKSLVSQIKKASENRLPYLKGEIKVQNIPLSG